MQPAGNSRQTFDSGKLAVHGLVLPSPSFTTGNAQGRDFSRPRDVAHSHGLSPSTLSACRVYRFRHIRTCSTPADTGTADEFDSARLWRRQHAGYGLGRDNRKYAEPYQFNAPGETRTPDPQLRRHPSANVSAQEASYNWPYNQSGSIRGAVPAAPARPARCRARESGPDPHHAAASNSADRRGSPAWCRR